MHVTGLSVHDFRSYAAADVALTPGITSFVGRNGQGKTNLVEALVYLSTLASHRVATDAPLVRAGAERATVRAEVARAGRTLLLEVEINPGRANRARINRSPVPRARELLGGLRTVLFAPEDLALVKGDPAERRRFLDDLLVARAPRFAGVRADYDRVVRQRNALLRSASAARRGGAGAADVTRTLDVWDSHLTDLGSQLCAGRLGLVHDLRPFVASAYAAVAPRGAGAELAYVAGWSEQDAPPTVRDEIAAALGDALARRRRDELERGVTLVGPHRDDLALSLGALPAKGYASHGESWSLALSLRLASYELLRADTVADGEPVLLLDDVFAELDTQRRERLAGLVAHAEQVIVTAAVPADIPAALAGTRFEVHDGTVRRAHAA